MVKLHQDQEFDIDKEVKKDYTVISAKKKERLIELVVEEKMTIYKAANRLGICNPTAKFIVKAYREANNLPVPPRKSASSKKSQVQKSENKTSSEISQKNQQGKSFSSHENAIQTNDANFSDGSSAYLAYFWNPYCAYPLLSFNYY